MSQNRNTNVTQTFIIEAIDDATFSACTGIYTNAIESCFGDVIYIGSDISSVGNYSGTSIYANAFYSGGTNLVNILNNASIYFHGHDHCFAKQAKDGIVYQEVPQPSSRNITNFTLTE